ncbi:hypothetical protein H7Y29_02005, partial [Microbacteriaceae bacterium]|nr:hypothetical protein [Candidatus Saccharibacteria bacterium]
MGAKQIKWFSARHVLFLITSVLFVSSFASLFGYTEPVYAATKEDCYAKFNGKTYRYTDLPLADQTLVNQCRSDGFCLVKSTDADLGTVTLSCANPTALPGGVSSNAAEAEVKPLVLLVCGAPPSSDTLTGLFLTCAANVRKIYASCDNTGGSITSSVQDTDANTAKCILGKLSNPKPAIAKILSAVKSGRADANNIVDTAITDQQNSAEKAKCDARIKNGEKVEWNGSTCVAVKGSGTTCAIDGVGWLVCPVMTFMANIVDKSYGIVSAMLTVNTFSTTNNPVMLKAWGNMRNLANVAFVIAFLIVVYSQVTGAGISNYGLKRMLPRIIVAAILVNLSFWLCALAVDASNIVGASMRNLIQGAGGADLGAAKIQSAGATGVGWVGIVGGILSASIIGVAALYVGLAALLPALISALFVIVTVLLVLALRQALIILLVVISPLAFVAYLLPNTNEWFTKWRKLFVALLLMYPVVGVLFGASALASTIVQSGAAGGTGAGDEGIKIAVQIMGALLQILPLVLLPTLMKTSTSVLGKFGGMINNPNKGPFDRMKKGANNLRERQEGRRTIRALNGGRSMGFGKYQRQAKKQAIDSGIKQNVGNAQNQYVASQVNSNPSLANKVAGGTGFNQASSTDVARAIQNAQFTIDKAEAEEVKAARVTFDRTGVGSNSAMDMID